MSRFEIIKILVGVIGCCLLVNIVGVIGGSSSSYSAATAELENEARLLVHKELLSRYVIENLDTVIKYTIYNIGGVTATNVLLKDPVLGTDFEVTGATEVHFGRIPPQGNTTHTIIVKPLKPGYFNLTSGVVTYSSGENTQEVHLMYSSEPVPNDSPVYIASYRDFDKRFSPHFLDWTAFAVMAIPPLFIPFMLWHASKSKYENVVVSKKGK